MADSADNVHNDDVNDVDQQMSNDKSTEETDPDFSRKFFLNELRFA
jgi:hypothetical protein